MLEDKWQDRGLRGTGWGLCHSSKGQEEDPPPTGVMDSGDDDQGISKQTLQWGHQEGDAEALGLSSWTKDTLSAGLAQA